MFFHRAGVAELSRALAANCGLRKLSLSRTALDDEGGVALAQGLRSNSRLQELFIDLAQLLFVSGVCRLEAKLAHTSRYSYDDRATKPSAHVAGGDAVSGARLWLALQVPTEASGNQISSLRESLPSRVTAYGAAGQALTHGNSGHT